MVDELGYNGFERLRRGFDRAFGGRDNVPTFKLVIDAGCGTGLVGEQVSRRRMVIISRQRSTLIQQTLFWHNSFEM